MPFPPALGTTAARMRVGGKRAGGTWRAGNSKVESCARSGAKSLKPLDTHTLAPTPPPSPPHPAEVPTRMRASVTSRCEQSKAPKPLRQKGAGCSCRAQAMARMMRKPRGQGRLEQPTAGGKTTLEHSPAATRGHRQRLREARDRPGAGWAGSHAASSWRWMRRRSRVKLLVRKRLPSSPNCACSTGPRTSVSPTLVRRRGAPPHACRPQLCTRAALSLAP